MAQPPNFFVNPQGGVYPGGFDPRLLPAVQKLQQTNPTLWQQILAESQAAQGQLQLPPPSTPDFTVNSAGEASPAGIKLDATRAEATKPLQLEYKPGLGFKGEKLAPGLGGEAAAAAEGAAPGMLRSALGGVGRLLGPVGAAAAGLETLNMPQNYWQNALGQDAQGKPNLQGISPSEIAQGMNVDPLAKSAMDILGTGMFGDPKVSRFDEKMKQLIALPFTLPMTTYFKSKNAIDKVSNWLFDAGDRNPSPQNDMEFPSAFDAFNNLKGSLGTNSGPSATNSWDIPGMGVDRLPEPPQMGTPDKVDTSKVQEWLAKAAPKEPKKDDSSKLETALGLLQGAANADWMHGTGRGLAQVGAGAIGGLVQGMRENKKEQQQYEAAQRDYASLMAGNSLDIAKLDASHQEKLLDISYKNAMLKYETALKNIELTKPKFVGMENGVAMYQTVDPTTGQMKLNSFDTGLMRQQAMLKALMRQNVGPGGTKIADLGAATLASPGISNDAFGYYSQAASDVLNSSLGPMVLGQKVWDQLEQDAMLHAQQTPGSDTEKNAAFKSYIIGHTAGMMMNDPRLVGAAAPYSPFARGLVPFLQPRVANGQK